MRTPTNAVLVIAMMFLVPGLTASVMRADLSADDRERVQEVSERFVEAWLLDAPQSVISNLDPGAVLIPHHGVTPVVGEASTRAFWWPSGVPPARLLTFEQTYDEIDGDGDLAFVRGRFELAFEWESEGRIQTVSSEGNYLMLLRRDAGGEWKISHRIWNDPVPEVY